jgi:hypothetical protein
VTLNAHRPSLRGLRDEPSEVDGGGREGVRALELLDRQQRAGELFEAVELVDDHVGVLDHRRPRRLALDEVEVTPRNGQWCTHGVRDVAEELALPLTQGALVLGHHLDLSLRCEATFGVPHLPGEDQRHQRNFGALVEREHVLRVPRQQHGARQQRDRAEQQ